MNLKWINPVVFLACLPDIVLNMQDIEKISIVDGVAEYRIKKIEPEGVITYYIYFVIDENGIWGIKQF